METEEEDPKEEPIKEIKEVKGQGMLNWGPTCVVCSIYTELNMYLMDIKTVSNLTFEFLGFFEVSNIFPFERFINILGVIIFVLKCGCGFIAYMCGYPWRPEESRFQILGSVVTGSVNCLIWELNSGPWEEQYTFLTAELSPALSFLYLTEVH